jgi:hypothetical protein
MTRVAVDLINVHMARSWSYMILHMMVWTLLDQQVCQHLSISSLLNKTPRWINKMREMHVTLPS